MKMRRLKSQALFLCGWCVPAIPAICVMWTYVSQLCAALGGFASLFAYITTCIVTMWPSPEFWGLERPS